LASGLLQQEQIDRAWQSLAEDSLAAEQSLEDVTDEALSKHLVRLGYLNRWQAEQLRHGRTKFTLGPYRIVDAIGHGGMGYVFKGEHVLLGRIEAIKVLPKTQMHPASIAAFCREIRAQAQLDHPNLVRLSFADKDGDTYFLVTEFIEGSDLRRLVRHHGVLSARQAAVIASQTAEALAYAHERGLVHRDVKPGNLLVTPQGHTKLTDLGLASFSWDATPGSEASKHIVGTPDFLAPEAILAPANPRPVSDLYSLGCSLYYAVTGKVPFPGGQTSDKLRRHLEEAPLTPARLNPGLDGEFVDLIADMMHKRPDQRIQRAADVVERLKRWTSEADATTWKQLGEYAAAPGERSLGGAAVADTIPVHAEVLDSGDRSRDSDWPSPPPGAAWTPPDGIPAKGADDNAPRVDYPPFEIAGVSGVALLILAATVGAALTAIVIVLLSF
jgi:serine/threonine protein kinase